MKRSVDEYVVRLYGLAEAVFHNVMDKEPDYVVAHIAGDEDNAWEMRPCDYMIIQDIKNELNKLSRIEDDVL